MRSVEELSVVDATQDMLFLRSFRNVVLLFRIWNNEVHINHRYNGLINGHNVSVITDVHHHRLKEYSWKYTIGYIANIHKKQEDVIVLTFFLH
jgi:hypothetical protein